MKSNPLLVPVLLAAATAPQTSVAFEPPPYTCSLLLRSHPTREPDLIKHFAEQSDISGAYVCFDQLSDRLDHYQSVLGPYRLGDVAFFRLSGTHLVATGSQYSEYTDPERGLLSCFKERGTCSAGDFTIQTRGIHETELAPLKHLSDEIILLASTGTFASYIPADAGLSLVRIDRSSDGESLSFLFRSRFGGRTGLSVRNNTERLEVIGFF